MPSRRDTELTAPDSRIVARSPMMWLRLQLYPYRRWLLWLRRLARRQMRLHLDAERQWRFCRWVSLLTVAPGELTPWHMPGTGLEFNLDLLETIQMSLYYRDGFQPEIVYQVREHLRPDRLFIDAGANVGLHSLVAGEYYRDHGTATGGPFVLAFEPNPRVFVRLQDNISSNRLQPVIRAEPFAVSEREDTTFFYLSGADNSTASSLASLGPGHQQTGERVQVRTIALAGYLRQEGITRTVGLIKLDIEGAELLALRGGREMIERDQPVIILEVYPSLMEAFGYGFEDAREFMHSLRYRVFRVTEDGALVDLDRGPWPAHIPYGDIICFPAEASNDGSSS